LSTRAAPPAQLLDDAVRFFRRLRRAMMLKASTAAEKVMAT
jgi:hypothetical protein